MNPRAAIQRMGRVLAQITNGARSATVTRPPRLAPAPVHSRPLAYLTAKEMGEWYVHTLLGR